MKVKFNYFLFILSLLVNSITVCSYSASKTSAPPATPTPSAHSYLAQWGKLGPGKGQLWGAFGIAVGPSGNVYVADYVNDRIEVFDSSGVYVNQWGCKGTGTLQLHHALGVALDPMKMCTSPIH